ncbi:MAG TPA: FAD:protein FMN transferase [Rugosimonospora sp.]|nr:FAD:protein FMN transferase [Rugosimonospora sp.]
MPLLETLPVGPDTAQWSVWGTTARIVVTEPDVLPYAVPEIRAALAGIDAACSRFREDSELRRLQSAGGRPVTVSPLLAGLIEAALWAAEHTGGDVDPTVGAALHDLGYDRDLALIRKDRAFPINGSTMRLLVMPAPGWQRVRLRGNELTVPAGVRLDLGASAKAFAADSCARSVSERFGTGVMVSLGGDIATAGPGPEGGWRVLVQDQPGEPAGTVALSAGTALATSSTLSRRWRSGTRELHHIIDPRTGQPARQVWRTVSVGAQNCLEANALTTAAVVRGEAAEPWLRRVNLPARLVHADGRVLTMGGWPA